MATSVGLASSVTQSKAAQAKKQRKAAAVPTTPEIKATVAKIRANNSGTKAETAPNHDDVRESWRETVAEMKLVIRDMRARANQEAQAVAPVKPPVVFETFVQVVEETAPVFMVGLTSEPAPLPETVMIVDVPLLPAECERRIAVVNVLPTLDYVIELLPSFTDYWADRARIRQRILWEKVDCGEAVFDCQERPPQHRTVESKPHGVSYASAYAGSLARSR